MHLLYCDESGAVRDAAQMHFVLAGVSVFERQGYWLANKLDNIAARFNPATTGSVELHGSPMFGGKKFWRRFQKPDRTQAICDALQVLAESPDSNRIFACVVNKQLVSPHDPVEFAFEQVASRFDYYLKRLHNRNDTQRGLMIFDKSTYEETIQNLATDFRTIGTRWNVIANLAEVPLFLDSKASRLIQLADLVAFAIYRQYEHGDNAFYKIIADRIDSDGGVRHGLHEVV